MEYLGQEIEEIKNANGYVICKRFKKMGSINQIKDICKMLTENNDFGGGKKSFIVNHAIEGSDICMLNKIYYENVEYSYGEFFDDSLRFSIMIYGEWIDTGEVKLLPGALFTIGRDRWGDPYISGIDYSNSINSYSIKKDKYSEKNDDEDREIYSTRDFMIDNGYDPENESIEDMYGID